MSRTHVHPEGKTVQGGRLGEWEAEDRVKEGK